MNRCEIVKTIGCQFSTNNLENGEFSYSKALARVGKKAEDYRIPEGKKYHFLDLRFEGERLVILVECKYKFPERNKDEMYRKLQQFVNYEKVLSGKKIVALLVETEGDEVLTWCGESVIIDEAHRLKEEKTIRSFDEYEDKCFGINNNKTCGKI